MPTRGRLWPFALAPLVASLGCSRGSPAAHELRAAAPVASASDEGERPVQLLDAEGDLADRRAEVSGFAWYGDDLLVVSQRPTWNPANGPGGCFYALSRASIEKAIAEGAPLRGRPVPLEGLGKLSGIEGLQGFEAAAFSGSSVTFLLEAEGQTGMRGRVASGHVVGALEAIVIDQLSPLELPAQTPLRNLSYEALVRAGGDLLAIYEANGKPNPEPRAMRLSPSLDRATPVAFPRLEYRVTDATPPDADGAFWVINYFYPPETALACQNEALASRYGSGPTQKPGLPVERLVRLRVNDQGAVTIADEPPVRLTLRDDGRPRNWEALALLPGRGFLLATDKHPSTLFGFVRYPLALSLQRGALFR